MQKYTPPLISGFVLLLIGLFVGTPFHIYDTVPHFDKVLHVTGGILVAWFSAGFISSMPMPKLYRFIGIVGAAMLVGVLWEFAEYSSGIINNHAGIIYYYFHGGDLTDTLGDLLADMVGAVIYAWMLVGTKF